MHVQGAPFEQFPDFVNRKPTAGEVSHQVERERRPALAQRIRAQTKHAAQARGEQLSLPLLLVVRLVRQHDFARHQSWPGEVVPTPEARRRHAGHTGDGSRVAFPPNGQAAPFGGSLRHGAGRTIGCAIDQSAALAGIGLFHQADLRGEKTFDIGRFRPAGRRHGDRPLGAIDFHRLQRRLGFHRLGDSPRQAQHRVGFSGRRRLGLSLHEPSNITHFSRWSKVAFSIRIAGLCASFLGPDFPIKPSRSPPMLVRQTRAQLCNARRFGAQRPVEESKPPFKSQGHPASPAELSSILLFGCIACKPSWRGFLPSRGHRTKPARNPNVSRP